MAIKRVMTELVCSPASVGLSLYLQGNPCNVIGVQVEQKVEVGHDGKKGRTLLVLNVACKCVKILCV